ncbi:MAG: hypothetical protein DHS20C17_35360 [Cyclobacteriaceae bacterium]|nr:MAG: hypothetical protein DHS20C17_35360 [Cyclobacteriaceae bacterium]
MSKQKPSTKKSIFFHIVLLLIPITTLVLTYLAYTTFRTVQFYNYVKSDQRDWSGQVHQAHKELGYAPIPNSHGWEIMPLGPDIPVRYDKDGFRIPVDEKLKTTNNHPFALTLGCSFTYGAATHAENTFPYLIGTDFGVSTKNAGVCSYGLSQMVLIAKLLIPRHKPDYVIVQYSPWLVKRAIQPFAPSYYGKLPNPYYFGESALGIAPAVFQTKVFDLPIDNYRNTQKGVSDFFLFSVNIGFPLLLHDDFNMTKYTLAKFLRLTNGPTKNRSAVIQDAYKEIANMAEQNNARMIIVILGENHLPVPISKDLFPRNAVVIDAHSELLNRLPTIDEKSFQRHYNHWRGEPPTLVDTHPNELAHKIIAEMITLQMVKFSKKEI